MQDAVTAPRVGRAVPQGDSAQRRYPPSVNLCTRKRMIMSHVRLSILVLSILIQFAPAQQPNTGPASMVLGGVSGPPWPVQLPINSAI